MHKEENNLFIGDRVFSSRLFIGTGKFSSALEMREVLDISGAEIVTVALRRVNLESPKDEVMSALKSYKGLIVPNTSGARNSKEAIRLARLAAEALGHKWVKLEVTPEPDYLLPDPVETLEAARVLCKEGFSVMPYIQADPILAKHLEEVGCVCVMPLGSPIGSNKGLRTRDFLEMILEKALVPVIVDAGIGVPSDAGEAMEMGASAVLVNTAIATAGNPVKMAEAFSLATKAGRMAHLSKIPLLKNKADSSSPLMGFLR